MKESERFKFHEDHEGDPQAAMVKIENELISQLRTLARQEPAVESDGEQLVIETGNFTITRNPEKDKFMLYSEPPFTLPALERYGYTAPFVTILDGGMRLWAFTEDGSLEELSGDAKIETGKNLLIAFDYILGLEPDDRFIHG